MTEAPSLIIACMVKTRERFMRIGRVITMPIFFASNAIYSLDIRPGWLRAMATTNPLTHQVDALRALALRDGESMFGIASDFRVRTLGVATSIGVTAMLCGRRGA